MLMPSISSTTDPINWIEAISSADPQRPWLETEGGQVITYHMLHDDIAAMAAKLTGVGIKPGDRVAACVEKSPEAVILYFACLWIGAIYMPLNIGYTPSEIAYFLEDAEPAMFVGDGEVGQTHSLADIAALPDAPITERTIFAPDTIAAMLYTSGTTGRPKGAMLTRANLASNAVALMNAWAITAKDVLIHALPIFHVHGLFIAINSMTAAGAQMLFRQKFDPEDVIALMPRATMLMGVPTFYTRLLNTPALTREVVAPMRLFISGSAPLLAETHRQFEARTGHAILERYGMTETGINTSNPYDGARIAGTVGLPLSGVEVRISDAAEGIGEIEVRGPNVFAGYWRNPEKTAADFREGGWFVTGDLGKIDAQGYVHIIGRGKDLIITGGYNVYPKEVEDVIDALPGVTESAVIGVPHDDFGEAVVAVVVGTDLDPAAILGQLRVSRRINSLRRFTSLTPFPATRWARCRKRCCERCGGRWAICLLLSATLCITL
jgi:malonyl-CoA/methylmalonyl-CoA synthetase